MTSDHGLTLSGTADVPAIQQLGRALWRTEGLRGAAVLVGAGVSRGAQLVSGDMPPPPLWSDLANAMKLELYPDNPRAAPWDPLRLAEEYRTYFGQAALDAFVRIHIRDSGWNPSANHDSLLSLPWSDVLTTNYDTLLERAARRADRAYEPVRTEADIAFAKAPRIVKLHGSIGATDHFVIAEEDYRTYPAMHAAFVNLARQAFVENELCLIGFSGDDPNFLAWAGWVRDHLGSSARRIFLAGALNLGPAKRKFLEARNIAPIDVYAAVRHLDPVEAHEAATRLILESLAAMRPQPAHEWTLRHLGSASAPAGDVPAQAVQLQLVLAEWRKERTKYPGWVICPFPKRYRLRLETDSAPIHPKALEELRPELAAELMFELCWRYQTALWPMHPQIAALVLRFGTPTDASRLDHQKRLLIAQTLLAYAREQRDDKLFQEMRALIEATAIPGSDALAQLRYQEALIACRDMDFPEATALAEQLSGTDPIWVLRRAALLTEAGHIERSDALVAEALADLRDRERQHRSSIWIRSRLAWTSLMHRAHRQDQFESHSWSERFRESRCDPFQEVESLAIEIASERRKKESRPSGIVPNFEAGSYRLPAQTIHFGSSKVEPNAELTQVLEQGGVPPRLLHTNMFVQERMEALELAYEPSLAWYLQLLRGGATPTKVPFNRYFARVSVAALSDDVVSGLVRRLKVARSHWTSLIETAAQRERHFAMDRLEVVLELLARLVLRLSSGEAAELHRETLNLWASERMQTYALAQPVARLLANSFEAVQPDDRGDLVLPNLQMSLSADPNMPDPVEWLSTATPKGARESAAFRNDVNRFLQAAEPGSPLRGAAISRLTYLHQVGALTDSEADRFSEAAWAATDSNDPPLPAASSVFPHFWAKLPSPPNRDVAATVRTRVYTLPNEALNKEHFHTMIRAARSGVAAPNSDQARVAFDQVVRFRPRETDESDVGAVLVANLSGYDARVEANFAGAVLSYALAPFLAKKDLTADRAKAAIGFIKETGSLSAAGALVPFLSKHEDAREELVTLIRQGLLARQREVVGYAADALSIWLESSGRSGTDAVPKQVVEQLVSVIELRRPPGLWRLLDVATTLARKNRIDSELLRRLTVALGDLLIEANYEFIPPLSEEAGEISLVRKHCVKLAAALEAGGSNEWVIAQWRDIADSDPLPEVRYARGEGTSQED